MSSLKGNLKQRGRKQSTPVPVSAEDGALVQRPTTRIDQASPREMRIVQKIYESIPDGEVIEALQHSSDPKAVHLLRIMHDPAFDEVSFAVKCREAGMQPEKVWQMVISLHKLDGDIRVARRIPQIMESIANEAIPQTIDCPKCKGVGTVPNKEDGRDDCPHCGGLGQLLIPADNDARKMALEAAGVIGQRGPLIDARSVHMGGGGSSGGDVGAPDMTDWSRSTDHLFEERSAYHKPAAEEAETVDE